MPDTSPAPLSLQIGIAYAQGGAGRVFAELSRHLPAAGFGFAGLVAGPADAEAVSHGLVRTFAPAGAGLAQRLLGVRAAVRDSMRRGPRPAIVASHFALYTLPVLDGLHGAPLVSHFHGPWALESAAEGQGRLAAAVKSRVEGAVYRRSARVIVLSEAFGRLAVESFGVAPERVRVVPGCVDVERFGAAGDRAEARRALGLPLGRPLLVCVRRLVQRMGLETLLQAMTQVRTAVPEVLLCLGGSGPLARALEERAEQLGLAEHVRLLGFVSEAELPQLYAAADLNVVPSAALEGFGLVAAESLAAGTPSLVTPVGGLPEVVSGLAPELVMAGTDAASIAAALVAALTGRLPLPSPEACRAYARQHFAAGLMAERIAAVYRELL